MSKTNKSLPSKYNSATIEKARNLYMNHEPISRICEATDMKRASVLYYIPAWRDERDAKKREIIDALTDNKKALLSAIAKNGLEVLAKSMEMLKKQAEPLTTKEMLGVANIVDSLDKISKLDDGTPTEILAELKPSTTYEIRQLLKKDPFLELEEAELLEKDVLNAE